jgi:hypothetical protein
MREAAARAQLGLANTDDESIKAVFHLAWRLRLSQQHVGRDAGFVPQYGALEQDSGTLCGREGRDAWNLTAKRFIDPAAPLNLNAMSLMSPKLSRRAPRDQNRRCCSNSPGGKY